MHIVYLHGFNGTQHSWGYVHDHLPPHKATFIEYNSHQAMQDSLDAIGKKVPHGPISIVGHSLGGVLGTLLASRLKNVQDLVAISAPLGGTASAKTLRWVPGHPRIIDDLVPEGSLIQKIQSLHLEIPTLSVISTGGHIQLLMSIEKNDSVVTLSSQRSMPFGKKIEVQANHFEVLTHRKTVKILQDFLFEEAA